MADELKIGAYLCKGCGLGERLDVSQLATIAEREGKANLVREHDVLCSSAGVEMMRSDIESEGVNRVVIGACSRRSKTEAFDFDGAAISRANLREGVIWVRPDTEEARETTQEMAADYVRMGCAEVRHMKPPRRNDKTAENREVLVVGGGVSGMTAALEASKAGYKAALVERSGELGGHAARLQKRVPARSPYADPVDTGVAELKSAVEADPNITVHLSSTVARTSGAPGQFSVDIANSGGTDSQRFGAVIMASGFEPYDANNLPELGYGRSPDVVTQLELEELVGQAGDGPIKRPSDGKTVEKVAFIQCAGQRSDKEGHLPYCSGHCCSTSIKQAMYFKERNPGVDANILYTDLRTPGVSGEEFYRSGQRKGVVFTKGEVNEVTASNGALRLKLKDYILDEEVEDDADMVVLATGMVANSGNDVEEEGEILSHRGHPVEMKPVSILNLSYRQGSDLPHLKYGFNDSHFICFPYETRRSGIYTTGPVRRPMDLGSAAEDATGAALKAIQSIENAAQGQAVHPRSGDLSFPRVDYQGCTQCKRCTVECPFGAIDEDEQTYPVFNESRCRRCGTCMGACPVRVISFDNYSIDTVGQQIKNIDMPDEFDEKPRILVLACENDAYPALDMAAMNRIQYSAFARVVPVRCLGSVNSIWITDALNSGYDGVVLMGCQKGENYQCHFVKGSEMAHYRMSKIDDTLEQLSLERERVTTHEVAITDIQRAPELIEEMAATIERVGMSPFKF
ncbi:MAG: hydrogenase iron-sulfur subunit [Gammaproteobacteria bacterium]|nr:hydrogenase iron-sulfur subunit [Gammaproteobacteria bacterium]NIU05494.1 hydrogenase iron-sulfur subunit [Gammaproteobacteria bacterium]NIV52640.1 hydrogenase iron-sulfur subunit [Gammaproteobacteria bacterium]NIX86767.1 hydrogenase iron-sulfur subunit [Gammaproteobacteria bacterium]